MDKKKWFMVCSWGTIIVGVWVIFDAFNPDIAFFGEFYIYLILISGIVGIIGAVISLGIFPTIGGLAICVSMVYISIQHSIFLVPTFIKASILLVFGAAMILTYDEPYDLQTFPIPRLGMNKEEFLVLKDLGITTLQELIEEKGNEEEICSITTLSGAQLKKWIEKAEDLLQEHEKEKKTQLKKDFRQKYKK